MKFNISTTRIALAAAALAVVSCTANYEEINRNPYEVTADDMERDGYAMRSFLTTMQSWVIPTEVNQCQFTDLLLGGPYGGYIADANSGFNAGKFSTYDPQSNWSEVYYRVVYTNEMSNFSELCKVTEDENAIAVAKVVKVAGVHRVADTYGPIPYTGVGTGADPVPLDSEEEVFKAMFRDLNDAIEVLTRNRTSKISADADRLYGGSLEKWGQLANSLKLRLAMRIVYANPTLAQEMAESAVSSELGLIESNDGNAMYSGYGKDGNPFYVCFFSYKSGKGDHRVAADIASYMNGYEDPRRESYFTPSTFTGADVTNGYIGLRNGIQIPEDELINNYSLYNVTASTSLMWINASEVAFLRAEGALRGWAMGGDARSFYEQGILLSFERCGVAGKVSEYLASEGVPGSYNDPAFGYNYSNESSVTIPWNTLNEAAFEENLERIITQKWIANFPLGSEAWADYRRTGYPRLFQVAVNNNPDITNLRLGARRLTYPLSEYEANGTTIQAAVDRYLGGQDKMSTRLWWDCNPAVR